MSLLDMLTDQLAGERTAQIGRQLGTDEGTAGKAIAAALPLLMGALAKNASRGSGADSLASALERDHDGSVLDDLGGFLSSPDTRSGDGILRHTLGERRGAVEQELGRRTGVDAGSIAQLLPILAPIVMGALGKAKRQESLDTSGLVSMLSGEQRRADSMSSGTSDMLTMLLDSDRDGSVADDVAQAGIGFLGKLLRRRR
ncbi:MAG: DUF937 domain-containing protein [Gemmatimonadota bacterium]|nr:MAG: DUF937 domain-containing protein [Gemmatimonadota bacterium]